ncbi:MAG: alpha-maltose-phosphate synthase [Actinomycetota bacterium]|jgi:starch synthase|nr:alpha-maltose-phosphate synthase [Actinomycetota bacterium]
MRVALLTREYPPEVYGGAGVHVEYLSEHLARLVDLDVFCFGKRRESPLVKAAFEPWEAIGSGRSSRGTPPDPRPHDAVLRTLSVDLLMAAAVEGADVVHSHTWYANFAGHLARMLYDIPHVVTTHSLEPHRPWKAEQLGGGYAVSSFCERTALESADAVIAVSAAMKDDVLGCYPALDPDRVVVIHNGVDTDEFTPDHHTDALPALGIDPTRPYVTFVGRITRQKGIDLLLAAAERFDPDTQLVLLPSAPDTPEVGEEMRARAAALAERRTGVLWLERVLPRPELIEVLSNSVVAICPSVYEPFGLVNVEAMACATAVVASDVGGIPEIVLDGETGTLVHLELGPDGRPADAGVFVADLAAAVNALVADPATAERMGAMGRKRAVEEFSWPSIAARTVELYRSL